ncbi:hypothetical protein [Prevotella sp. P6B4]|uniref:hypothetical protein n=1 Tax=Prevotella sp. P6B4 TaxID=1410614 RepID=UPI00048D3201|nr:hypothetical protein [Prevotella sp. P6B4]
MKKKYLLWGYAVIAICSIVILITITITSVAGIKATRNRMSNPENRRAIYDTAAKVTRDTGLKFPDFRIQEQKAGEFIADGALWQDTLVVYFYKGISKDVFRSFEERAKTISETNDTTKSVRIDSLNYYYQDRYVSGFRSSVMVHINRNSQYGEIIYGNWSDKTK